MERAHTIGLSRLFARREWSRRLGQRLREYAADDDTGRFPHLLCLGVVLLPSLFLIVSMASVSLIIRNCVAQQSGKCRRTSGLPV